ncbi:hypothetical protein ACH4GZ_00095 [Streptomyces hygroscopicus]|uniref:hypothetical protein n=1 Tax=Streptomyces hygroscopicus TaxID=1912 RepID=UPI0037883809
MSTFDAEWAQLKREASGEAGMSLASADNKPGWEQGGGSGGVKSSKDAWSAAGRSVGKLRGDIKTALTKLEEEQTGLGAGSKSGGGIESAAAQRELCASWKRYLNGVSGKCGTLQDRLEKAGDHHYRNDEAIKSAFDGIDGLYKDTKPVGGESRGR